PDPAYSGVSGLVVIAESHIAIHTFPELDYFTMDIFSCKNFDHEKAIEYIRSAFDVEEMDRMLVQRGLSFRRASAAAISSSVAPFLPWCGPLNERPRCTSMRSISFTSKALRMYSMAFSWSKFLHEKMSI